MTADEVARFRREIVEYGALPHALGWYRALPLGNPGSADHQVTVPTTFVWSDARRRDPPGWASTAPSGGWTRRTSWSCSSGVSHWIPTQAPDALAAAILARVLPR